MKYFRRRRLCVVSTRIQNAIRDETKIETKIGRARHGSRAFSKRGFGGVGQGRMV